MIAPVAWPYAHTSISPYGMVVGAEDRADVCAVVVAVVNRLDDHDPQVQLHELALSFLLDRVFSCDPARHLDQLVAAARGVLPQLGQGRSRLIAFVDLGLCACEASEVALLGGNEVQQGGGDGSIRARSGQLQLVVGQLRADVQQVQVRPLVVAEGFDQQLVQDPLILTW